MQVKYDNIGRGYNQTRKPDPFLISQLIKHLQPEIGKSYLDIGCGTGNYTSALQNMGFSFTGIDPSEKMLKGAKNRNSKINWIQGSAENTSLSSESLDGVIGTLTMHHWTDLDAGFKELFRVLRPKGKIVLFTATPKQMEGYWLNHYFPKMIKDSSKLMPTFPVLESGLNEAGFQFKYCDNYDVKPDLQDKFLYCGKQNPELYFNPSIRHGISSFSDVANLKEVHNGLKELRNDIGSGAIKSVIDSYSNHEGDYLYVVAEKN